MQKTSTPQLRQFLIDNAEQVIARWVQRLSSVVPNHGSQFPSVHVRRLYELLLTLPTEQTDIEVALVELGIDWQAFELTTLIQLSFQLRPAIVDVLQTHKLTRWQSSNELDQLVERCTILLTNHHNTTVQAELREQVAQAEYLLDHQAQMASESDYFALQMSTLYELSQAMSASLDREILEDIGPRILSAFTVERCAIVLRIDDDTWLIEHAWGDDWAGLTGQPLDPQNLPDALKLATAQGMVQLQPVIEPASTSWMIAGQGALFVPLRQEKHVLGCLVAQGSTLIERIDDVMMNLWRTVANQVVVTLQNIRLYSTVQQLNADLERKVDERTAELSEERDRLEAIADIARDISTLEIDVLLNRILQALANLTGVHHGSVMLIDAATGLLVDRATLAGISHVLGSRRFQIGEGLVGWIAQHRQPALVNDVTNDDRWVQVDAFGQEVGKNTGSLVGMPLIAGDDIVGVLMLSHPTPHFFNQSHMRLLKAIAGEIAIAIYNAQLYEYLAERTIKLSTMLRHQEEVSSQNNAILQSLNDAVIVFNLDRNIILANAAAESILDRPLDELVTQSFDELLESLQIKLLGDPLGMVLSNPDSAQTQDIIIKRGTQSISVTLVPVMTERGELLGACLIGRDITREVESDRLKTEFIGTVSHELRTPMTSIKGYTQLLAMGSLGEVNPTQKEFLNTIAHNSERMIAIINDLLDITKIETGSVELQLARLMIADVMSSVVGNARAEISQRQQEFSLSLAPNLPTIWSDMERIRQVASNVLSNAIKYTPNGGKISVRAYEINFNDIPAKQRDGLPAGRRYVALAVKDSGVGIDASEHEKVFERFYRTENPLKIEAGGTGLGLSLVRPLIQLMGGRIWLESAVNQGTTFTFIMPVAVD
ncbi:GAF domain-containing protein [Herpetosiphon llansteffanensis]|uniref:GAF domain-containing protein n=1 Tax=Herpetosiphon llansteffanensis TaxID=2094568 RepID=UPI000D7B9A09|nr:GAF domain-containing protein [Herpetosiphon llansteffanensis]